MKATFVFGDGFDAIYVDGKFKTQMDYGDFSTIEAILELLAPDVEIEQVEVDFDWLDKRNQTYPKLLKDLVCVD